jgi:TolB protein
VIPETAKNEKSMFQKLVKEQHFVRPTQMEIWISDADGTNAQPLTQLKGISFSPSFTPDGKSVIFSSNFKNPKEKNFALYLINLDGTGLQQVTSGNESDQYPEFSPDGKLLAFSSKRNARDAYETNVFIAEWQSPPQKP